MAKKDEPFLPLRDLNLNKGDIENLSKLIQEKGDIIKFADEILKPMLLCKYFDEGDNLCHAYVSVLPTKTEEYLKELAKGKKLVDPALYGGEIFRQGRGYPPAKEIQEEMEGKHLINHNLEQEMVKMFQEASKTIKGKFTAFNQPKNKKPGKKDPEEN